MIYGVMLTVKKFPQHVIYFYFFWTTLKQASRADFGLLGQDIDFFSIFQFSFSFQFPHCFILDFFFPILYSIILLSFSSRFPIFRFLINFSIFVFFTITIFKFVVSLIAKNQSRYRPRSTQGPSSSTSYQRYQQQHQQQRAPLATSPKQAAARDRSRTCGYNNNEGRAFRYLVWLS